MFLILLILCFFVNESLANKSSLVERRIYKGYDVGIHKYSFAVFLFFEVTSPSSCGASLIMVQAVITAAHCVHELRYNKGKITAFLGATVPYEAKVVRLATDYIIHPKYNEKKAINNMAVVFLEDRVPLKHEIKKIPLAVESPQDNKETVAAAWGKQIYGKLPDFSKRRSLKATKQKIISIKECAKLTGKSYQKLLCTKPLLGHLSKDDAGSGLIITKPSHILVGVLSHVVEDIGFYVNVASEHNWIVRSCYDLYKRNCPNRKMRGKNQSEFENANFI